MAIGFRARAVYLGYSSDFPSRPGWEVKQEETAAGIQKVEPSLAFSRISFHPLTHFLTWPLLFLFLREIFVLTINVIFDTTYQSNINTDHLSCFFNIDDAVDWKTTIKPFNANIWETDSALLDNPISDSDFDIFFPFDQKENSTDRVTKKKKISFLDPGDLHKKASSPENDHNRLNPKNVDSYKTHDDEASVIPSGGALISSDNYASSQLLNVSGHAATLGRSQDLELPLNSPDSHEPETPTDLGDYMPCTDSAKTSPSGDAPRAKRRRRQYENDPVADKEFFPSRREKKARLRKADRRSLDVINHGNCLRVKRVSLVIDKKSLCYEWNSYSERWEYRNNSEIIFMSSDIMDGLFAQLEADLLRV